MSLMVVRKKVWNSKNPIICLPYQSQTLVIKFILLYLYPPDSIRWMPWIMHGYATAATVCRYFTTFLFSVYSPDILPFSHLILSLW